MTHRSPLVTLAGLVVAFAIFFGANLANSAPGQATGPGYSSASASASSQDQSSETPSSPATTQQASPTASPSETASAEPEGDQFPDKVVYAGRTDDNRAAIAVAVLGDRAAAYVCDGRNVESWMRGTARDGELNLRAKNGDTLEAKLDGSTIEGTIELGDEKLDFTIDEAKRPAGLYRARGSAYTIGWIVLPDGSQVGIETRDDGTSTAAPKLDPDQPDLEVNGQSVTAKPVEGDEDI
jgi:hypothetical protein